MKLTENNKLRQIVLDRIRDAGFDKDSEFLMDLNDRGMKIDKSRWSKYKGGGTGITDEQLLFICFRLYIPVHFNIGVPEYKDDKIIWSVPKYDDLKALQLLKKWNNG